MKGGSAPVLALIAAGYGVAFFALRGSSNFLAVERQADALRAVASRDGIELATVLALREQAPTLPAAEFAALVAAFARLRCELGDGLAAVAVFSDATLAREVLQQHGGDRETAWQEFHCDGRAVAGLRLLQMRDRFAARAAAGPGTASAGR